ncbi:MAG: hypothetical protein WC496_12645 [Phycisphaerae bacterium]|jgi:hypothetical protein
MKESKSKKEKEGQLFKAGDKWWLNACIDPFHADWYAYSEGYKRAANILVEYVKTNRIDLDVLVYPIIYLYRHHLELCLKSIISNGRKLLDRSGEFQKIHKLNDLWREARIILEKVYKGDPTDELDEIEKVFDQFCSREPTGVDSRYPTYKDGNKTLPGLTHINIGEFSEIIMKVANFLDGANMGIVEKLDVKLS